ncbi:MAG: hypothetical protein QOI25_3809 [Mycobacterium sp.]|jgi:hypothetical protein|nr:hypothetical protein [Mycobacterium sp.]
MNLALRFGMPASLAVSAASHAVLYVHGYREIPVIGPGFLVQASVFAALAVLIALGGPLWLGGVAVLASAGSLIAFSLSRTVGLFGFTERGWQPAPHAAISVGAELLTLVLFVAALRLRRSPSRR